MYCLMSTALSVMGIKDAEVMDIFRLVTGILHLGNIQFSEDGNYSQIADKQCKLFCILIKIAFQCIYCQYTENLIHHVLYTLYV